MMGISKYRYTHHIDLINFLFLKEYVMYNSLGLEAIAFQHKPRLGNRLEALFDTFDEYIQEYDKDGESRSYKDNVTRYTDLHSLFIQKIVPKFKKIIKEEVNLTVQEVIVMQPIMASGLFAINLGYKTPEETNIGRAPLSGERVKKPSDIMDQLQQFSEGLDLQSGKLKRTKIGKTDYAIDIYFDLGMAFFADEIYPGTERLTSKEIAAIMLHEIGHGVTFVEHAGDVVYLGRMTAELYESLNSNTDAVKFIKDNDKSIISLIENSNIDKEHSDKLIGVVNKVSNNKEGGIPNYIMGLLSIVFISSFKLFLIIKVMTSLTGMLRLIMVSMAKSVISETVKQYKSYSPEKGGEDIFSNRNLYNFERISDEYVSRQGYSSHFASGLKKMIYLSKVSGISIPSNNMTLKHNWVIKNYINICSRVSSIFKLPFKSISLKYEDTQERIERFVQDNRAIFKDPNLPKEIREIYLSDTKELERLLNKSSMEKFEDFLSKSMRLFTSSPAILLNILSTGRLDKDAEIFLNKIDDMTSSKLYQQSQELKSLKK